ncbi:hypothetical protein T4B_3513 [Trichinella pseudospiralis]|uniref:Uncharacterized protein n=1 Tax=Trichinella pseudospiralis TaxID=6337 RepID=A0A0V1GJ59_TRIPS|nr:hypothetical protein T4B_3513 [Trichinella pseudospiralis]
MQITIAIKLLRKGVSELLRSIWLFYLYHYYSKWCILICGNSKVNEAKKGENANDTMQITDGI